MIVEPMDPDVDQVRLEARAGLAHAFAGLIEEGIASGEFAEQDARVRGAAIVGAFLEGVGAPLAERDSRAPDREAISGEIARFCQAAITATPAATPGATVSPAAGSPRVIALPDRNH